MWPNTGLLHAHVIYKLGFWIFFKHLSFSSNPSRCYPRSPHNPDTIDPRLIPTNFFSNPNTATSHPYLLPFLIANHLNLNTTSNRPSFFSCRYSTSISMGSPPLPFRSSATRLPHLASLSLFISCADHNPIYVSVLASRSPYPPSFTIANDHPKPHRLVYYLFLFIIYYLILYLII